MQHATTITNGSLTTRRKKSALESYSSMRTCSRQCGIKQRGANERRNIISVGTFKLGADNMRDMAKILRSRYSRAGRQTQRRKARKKAPFCAVYDSRN